MQVPLKCNPRQGVKTMTQEQEKLAIAAFLKSTDAMKEFADTHSWQIVTFTRLGNNGSYCSLKLKNLKKRMPYHEIIFDIKKEQNR